MLLSLLFATAFSLLLAACKGAPTVSLISNTQLDPHAIFFVSFDGVVNVEAFQLSGLLTYGNWQYAAWYTSSKYATLARRELPSGSWSTLQLPHQLSKSDSHNVVSLGVSPADGKIHVAFDCHASKLYYTTSEAGLATNGASWTASRFGSITNTLGSLNIGSAITYPQFIITPNNLLQLVYRSGGSGIGNMELAEYKGGSWSNVGSWATESGTYKSPNGHTSESRNLYNHGITYKSGVLHVTGTWREGNAAVSCSSAGLTNHDTVYFYSPDQGRTWKNSAGTAIGTAGSKPVSVNTAGIIVDSLDADHALMNSESQVVDSSGQIHSIISYVPTQYMQCVSNYEIDRPLYARPFHVYRHTNGTFTKVEIPFPVDSVGRSQIVLDSADNAYVILPFVRIVTASKSTGWTDWKLVYDGVSAKLDAFGEITLDRARLSTGVLSILYQVASSGTTPSALKVIDFKLDG